MYLRHRRQMPSCSPSSPSLPPPAVPAAPARYGRRLGRATGPADCAPAESPIVTLAAYSNVYDVYGKLTSDLHRAGRTSTRPERDPFPAVVRRQHDAGPERDRRLPGRRRRALARPRRPADPGRGAHHPRLRPRRPEDGIVASSAVVFDVRPGNPKDIDNWDDLAKPGIEILTPDPARAAARGGTSWPHTARRCRARSGYQANDPADAQRLLTGIFRTSPCWTRARTTPSRTSRRATATSRSRTSTRSSRRRTPAARTRW